MPSPGRWRWCSSGGKGAGCWYLGLVAYVIGALVLTAAYALPELITGEAFSSNPETAGMGAELDSAAQAALLEDRADAAVIRSGDYPAFARGNAAALPGDLAASLLLVFLETVPLVLIGMGLYRSGFFSGAVARGRLLRWSWGALVTGAAITLVMGVYEVRGGFSYYGTLSMVAGAGSLPRLPMILGLAGLLVAASSGAAGFWRRRIRAAGRMAFSNYLGTSLVMLFVFHGFGLDLFGRLGRIELYGIALAGGAVMLAWSAALAWPVQPRSAGMGVAVPDLRALAAAPPKNRRGRSFEHGEDGPGQQGAGAEQRPGPVEVMVAQCEGMDVQHAASSPCGADEQADQPGEQGSR